jgi:hypothetical protein
MRFTLLLDILTTIVFLKLLAYFKLATFHNELSIMNW